MSIKRTKAQLFGAINAATDPRSVAGATQAMLRNVSTEIEEGGFSLGDTAELRVALEVAIKIASEHFVTGCRARAKVAA